MAKTKLVLSRPGKRSSGVAEDEERGSGGGSSTASWSSSSGASSSASSSSGQKLPKWFKPGKWRYGLTFWQLFNKLVCCSHVVLPSFKTAKPLWLLHSFIDWDHPEYPIYLFIWNNLSRTSAETKQINWFNFPIRSVEEGKFWMENVEKLMRK